MSSGLSDGRPTGAGLYLINDHTATGFHNPTRARKKPGTWPGFSLMIDCADQKL